MADPTEAHCGYNLQLRRTIAGAGVEEILQDVGVRPLPAGVTYLVDGYTGQPFEPFLEFLVATAMTRSQTKLSLTKSRLTIEAYASDLCDYFAFLDAAQRQWNEADEVDAYHYIDSMIEHPSPVTGKPYADETIRRRFSSVRSYYRWAWAKGTCKTKLELVDPGECLRARRYQGGPGDATPPMSAASDREVRPIPPLELQALMFALGPDIALDPDPDIGVMSPTGIRNRLMAECSYHAGLRRAEVVELQSVHIMHHSLEAGSPYLMLPVRVFGKGAKWRTVNMPAWLVMGLQRYYAGPRAVALGEALDHGFLFVAHSTARLGARLSIKYFDDIFAAACVAAGLYHPANPAIAKYTVHHLRHNFALATYFARKQRGDPEPWLYIQSMLGHEFVETTLKIYLRAAKALEGIYSDYFDKAMRVMVENA